ncbi:MAG: hypothetical protein AB3X44_03240 [Leptothrix sp. (in: b-proteobacteria)]
MMGRYSKTYTGRVEIQARSHALSRAARNLLLIIDETRPADEWLTMLLGASEIDLAALLNAGLVELANQKSSLTTLPSTTLGYSDLYDSLNGLLREQLGLFRGYKFSLIVERASGHAELVEVARRFIDEVRELRGETAAEMVIRALGFNR